MAASFPLFAQMTSLVGPDGIHLASCRLVSHFHFLNLLPTYTVSLLISLAPPSPLCHCLYISLSPPSLSPLTAKADCLFENGLWLWVKATAWAVIGAARRESILALRAVICVENVQWMFTDKVTELLGSFFLQTFLVWLNNQPLSLFALSNVGPVVMSDVHLLWFSLTKMCFQPRSCVCMAMPSYHVCLRVCSSTVVNVWASLSRWML